MVIVPGRINGIDICGIQDINGSLDAKKIKESGFDFAYVKSSQYSSIRDLKFSSLVERLRDADIRVGAYHFCSHDSDPTKQAEHFFKSSKGLGSKPGELPPMCDWEYCTPSHYTNNPEYPLGHPGHCVWWIVTFMEAVTKLWYPDNALALNGVGDGRINPRLPVIYTYPNYSTTHQPHLGQAKGKINIYPLCYASYTPGTKLQPTRIPDHPLPKPFTSWTLCQHKGNDGRVPGIVGACDMQVFNGSQGEFDTFCGVLKPVHNSLFEVKEDVQIRKD